MKTFKTTLLIFAALIGLCAVFSALAMPDAPHALVSDQAGHNGMLGLAFGGMIINSATLNALMTNFNSAFQTGFTTAESMWNRIAMLAPSTSKSNTYGWIGKATGFRKWVGDRVIQNLEAHGYTIENVDFENTVGVDRNDIEDDNLGVYSPLMQQLGQDAAVHPDIMVFDLLKNGFTQTCYDGQFFFDTDHPVGVAGGAITTVSNSGGGAGTAWFLLDTSRMIKPVIFQKRRDYKFVSLINETDENVFMRKQYLYGVDARVNVGYGLWQLAYGSKQTLDATNFNAAMAAMMAFKNDNGQPLGIKPTVLVVPPSLRAAALTLLNAETINNGESNINRNAVDLIVAPWLA